MYWLTGRDLPMAFRHHAHDVYEKLMLPCMNHEGFFVYVSDNDWKRYHNWTDSCALHAYMAVLDAMKAADTTPDASEVTMRAENLTTVDVETGEKIMRMIDALEDLDDVAEVYSNADIPDEVLEAMG